MAELYGVDDDIPAEIASEVLKDNIPVGPPDEGAATDGEGDDE